MARGWNLNLHRSIPMSKDKRARKIGLRCALLGLVSGLIAIPGLVGASAAASQRTFDGVVRVLAADTVEDAVPGGHFKGHSRDIYRRILVVGDKTYEVKGVRLPSNRRVQVTGQLSGNEIQATSVAIGAEVAGISTAGTTRTLAMLAYWTAPDSVTSEGARSQLFSDTNGWYRDASYGGLGQTGDVTPWLRITGPTAGCYADSSSLMSQAKSAAVSAGYTLANYDNYILYFPYCGGDAAGYAGWAYVGAAGTWLNGYLDRRVTVHEEGHNYGLWHSHSNLCSGGGLTGSCSFSDYGDDYDAMGSSGYVGHFNASQKSLLGWLSGGRLTDLSAGGLATLVAMADDSTASHSAVVAVPGGTRKYWIEYRQAVEYDGWLPTSATDGVLVHVSGDGSGSSNSGASLIDVRPGDGISTGTATLTAGSSWTSPEGITIAVSSLTAQAASVSVGLPGSTYPLDLTKSGSGSGTVTSNPGGIACGATCAADFAEGTAVSLTATPAQGSMFAGWGGACSGIATCTVSMTAAKTVSATFNTGATCTITGTTGNDVLTGTAANDVICALEGNDVIKGQGGNDTLIGGPGSDKVDYANATAGVTANLTTGTATGQGTDTLRDIEYIDGSPYADKLDGDANVNWLAGKAGNDSVYGQGGNDNVWGGDGNDTLGGGDGNDTITGGLGVDIVKYGVAVSVDLTAGTATGQGTDSVKEIENVLGSTGADRLRGNSLVNNLQGGGGNDTLLGEGANDKLTGNDGNDSLTGGLGTDYCDGSAGTDTVATCETKVSIP